MHRVFRLRLQLLVDNARLADQREIHFFIVATTFDDFAFPFAPTIDVVRWLLVVVVVVRTVGHCDGSGDGVDMEQIGAGAGQRVTDALVAEAGRVQVFGGDLGDEGAGKGRF